MGPEAATQKFCEAVEKLTCMKNLFTKLKMPMIFGLILVLPFIALELINRRIFQEGFPITLFGILWLLPTAFFSTLLPIIREARAGNNIFENPIAFFLKAAFLAILANLWGAIILDQLLDRFFHGTAMFFQ